MHTCTLQFSLNFPAGSLPNLGASHPLEVSKNSVISKHPMACRAGSHYPVLSTLADTIFYTLVQLGCDLLRHCPTSLPSGASCVEGGNDDHSATTAQGYPGRRCFIIVLIDLKYALLCLFHGNQI